MASETSSVPPSQSPGTPGAYVHPPVEVPLRNPPLAALLAWLWPGLGHLYQGRTAKGVLFMVCILLTYFWGFAMGGGHVVYAAFRQPDVNYPFFLQIGVGLPVLPALIHHVAPDLGATMFGEFMAPPTLAPPPRPDEHPQHDELSSWNEQLKGYFDLATLYTMVAGLLNFLAVFDAFGGPSYTDLRPSRTT